MSSEEQFREIGNSTQTGTRSDTKTCTETREGAGKNLIIKAYARGGVFFKYFQYSTLLREKIEWKRRKYVQIGIEDPESPSLHWDTWGFGLSSVKCVNSNGQRWPERGTPLATYESNGHREQIALQKSPAFHDILCWETCDITFIKTRKSIAVHFFFFLMVNMGNGQHIRLVWRVERLKIG